MNGKNEKLIEALKSMRIPLNAPEVALLTEDAPREELLLNTAVVKSCSYGMTVSMRSLIKMTEFSKKVSVFLEKPAIVVKYLYVHTGYDERAYENEHWIEEYIDIKEELEACEEKTINLLPCDYGAMFEITAKTGSFEVASRILDMLYSRGSDKVTYCSISDMEKLQYDEEAGLLMVKFAAES